MNDLFNIAKNTLNYFCNLIAIKRNIYIYVSNNIDFYFIINYYDDFILMIEVI